MKTSNFLISIAGFISTAQAQYFNLTAVRAGTELNGLPVNAGGGRMYLNGTSPHYCPASVQTAGGCPNTDHTNFAGGNGTLAMGAIVPGGQMVYVDPKCGGVNYTQAHSAFMPTGAITTGWELDQVNGFGIMSFATPNTTTSKGSGFIACNEATDGTWNVYIDMADVPFPEDCLAFDMISSEEPEADAWQYE